jgi:hypothetical protein
VKGYVLKQFLLCVVAVFVVCFCNDWGIAVPNQDGVTKLPEGWQKLDTDFFSIYAPPSWQFHVGMALDSYTGEFVGDGARLEFDYGQYSNPLSEEKEPTYIVTKEKVSGHLARIVSPKVPGHGVTGIYFGDVGDSNKLDIFGQNLSESQQKTALTIFRTIRFRPMLPHR